MINTTEMMKISIIKMHFLRNEKFSSLLTDFHIRSDCAGAYSNFHLCISKDLRVPLGTFCTMT